MASSTASKVGSSATGTNGNGPTAPRPSAELLKSDPELYGRAVLAGKMAEVMAAAEHVEKRGKNDHFGYHYATEADVADALRLLLAERGICMIPTSRVVQTRPVTTSNNRDTFITEVVCQVEFIDSETGASFTAEMPGAGEDGMDKGAAKATTGAIKYVLMKTFALSTGDDPEQSQERSEGARSTGGKDDRPISENQRKVIFGKARGYNIDKQWIPRIIRYATKGRLADADAVQTNGQLDYVLGQLLAFSQAPDAAMAAIEAWEQEQEAAAPQAAAEDFTGDAGTPPFAGSGGDDDDESIPF